MLDRWLYPLTLIAALGCGLMAGLFFAFSVCVMRALARLPAAEGVAAMQSINVAIINPVFAVVFFGTPAACIFVIVVAVSHWDTLGGKYLLIGSATYLIGAFLVTFMFNVPRNNELASLTPTASNSADVWADYLSTWIAWNHVRIVASLAATVFLTLALAHPMTHG